MRISRKMSVSFWVNRLSKALDDAYATPKMQAKLQQLNSQANSIRNWDIGSGGNAKRTGGDGWRLLK